MQLLFNIEQVKDTLKNVSAISENHYARSGDH